MPTKKAEKTFDNTMIPVTNPVSKKKKQEIAVVVPPVTLKRPVTKPKKNVASPEIAAKGLPFHTEETTRRRVDLAVKQLADEMYEYLRLQRAGARGYFRRSTLENVEAKLIDLMEERGFGREE